MSQLSRRQFLGTTAAAAGALVTTASRGPAAYHVKSARDQVTLGKSGVKTSLVGMGTGSVGVNHSSNQVRLGQEKFIKLVRHAYDSGITSVDTADQYGSHIYLREAIRKLPRDKLFIQTKTRAQTVDVAKADLDRFLEELGTPYVDTLLMHCMTTAHW